jgi:hypothetical protein
VAVQHLPGVRVPAGAVGADRYGTAAIKSLESYASRLSAAQRRILRAVLTPHPGLTVDPAGGLAVSAGARSAKSTALTAFAPILLEAIKRLEAHGMVFKHKITLDLESSNASGDLAYTVATWLDGVGSVCAITFTPSGVALDLFGRRSVMLHELMHCAAAEQAPSKFAWDAQPKYLDEGLPEWA